MYGKIEHSTQFPKATLLKPNVMFKLYYFVYKIKFCGWKKSRGHMLWFVCQPTQDSTGFWDRFKCKDYW